MTILVHCVSEILALKHGTAQNALKNGLKKQTSKIFKCPLPFYLLMEVAKIWHSGRGPQWPQIAIKNFMQLICIILKFCKLRPQISQKVSEGPPRYYIRFRQSRERRIRI